jgi:hypothetical protein
MHSLGNVMIHVSRISGISSIHTELLTYLLVNKRSCNESGKVIESVTCYVANTVMYLPPASKNSMRELVKIVTIYVSPPIHFPYRVMDFD